MYKKLSKCRICGNKNLVSLLHLGEQSLTGVFPKTKTDKITSGPLELVKCHKNNSADNVCDLVQLNHSYSHEDMYGANYGYRSGLNQSMVNHLQSIVKKVMSTVVLQKGDLIIDIGSNDGTLLSKYPGLNGYKLVGIDPTGNKFRKYYPKHIHLVSDFFSSAIVKSHYQNQKAKIITSLAMFYDLEDPIKFAIQVFEVLEDSGIWVFEQSYLPLMLQTCAYDTICHEHLEYYGLKQIKWMMDRVGFKIISVELNDVNGGSFSVTVAKRNSTLKVNQQQIDKLLRNENVYKLDIYQKFAKNVNKHKQELCKLVKGINDSGKKIFGYGASTKGNVILQYCCFTNKDIPYIAEVNEDKFGAYTPFTHIPIISEKEAKAMKPDYFLVLPWHFREGILKKEKSFLEAGGKFILPLPKIKIIGIKRPMLISDESDN